MDDRRRNYGIATGLVVLLAIGAAVLPSALWACGLAVLLGLAGVVLLRGNRWRTGALLPPPLARTLARLDVVAGVLSPTPMGHGLVQTTDPKWWPPPDPVLGFRPQANTEVVATATFGPEQIYRRTYHFDGTAARVTPPGPPGADTYLFLGDSFVFGQGLVDDQSLAAQFAKANDYKVRTVNLGVPGYGPNHLVRAFEAGLLDRYADQSVKAYRWTPPLAGLKYLLGEQFLFVDAIGMRQRQEEQADLFVALMARLQQLAREKFSAPLIVVYSWPDETSKDSYGASSPFLVTVLNRLRKIGIPLLSVDQLTNKIDVSFLLIPHDGHPTARTYELIAGELKRRLNRP